MPERDFEHEIAMPRVVFGVGSTARIAAELSRLGAARVVLIGGGHEKVFADCVGDMLGQAVVEHISELAQHVPVEVAGRATARARAAAGDVLLPVGGGSAVGLAKAIALETGLPILAVPTTYAGSEMSPIWGLTEADRKTTGRDPRVLPRTVVYDPLTTVSLPPAMSAASGLNAIAHALECLYAPRVSPLLVLWAEEAIRSMGAALPLLVRRPDDIEARSQALYAAMLCGVALGNAPMGLHHKICHVLGGAQNLPHAQLHAVVLPYAAAYNRDSPAMAGAARALGADDVPAALWDLGRTVGTPASLLDIGFDPAAIPDVVDAVLAVDFPNPSAVTADRVRQLLENACTGRPPH